MHQLVIARYAEDLAWLASVPDRFEIHIYNKGAPITDEAVVARAATITDRPNEGRESETYLTHALNLEDDGAASDYVIFAQGDPFEHSPDFLGLLDHIAEWADIQPLAWRWKIARDIPPVAILDTETAGFLHGLRLRPETFSLQTWAPLGFHDVGTLWLQQTYREVHDLPDGINIAAHFFAMCGLPDLARYANAHLLGTFSYGAVFAARRTRIADVPPEALQNLRRAALSHEVYGYVLERLWLHLFGAAFAFPAPHVAPLDSPAVDSSFIPPDTRSKREKQVEKVLVRSTTFLKKSSKKLLPI